MVAKPIKRKETDLSIQNKELKRYETLYNLELLSNRGLVFGWLSLISGLANITSIQTTFGGTITGSVLGSDSVNFLCIMGGLLTIGGLLFGIIGLMFGTTKRKDLKSFNKEEKVCGLISLKSTICIVISSIGIGLTIISPLIIILIFLI